MQLWKPLLIVAPAGLVLGMIGGNLARPTLVQRAVDDSAQAMFHTRSERYGDASDYPQQADGATYYDGGYSYAPDSAVPMNADWSPPKTDELAYADMRLPSLAELDARQAALLADPEKQYTVDQAAQDAHEADAPGDTDNGPTVAIADRPADSGPEPRRADGEPAIW